MTSAGLTVTDVGKKGSIGGFALEYYRRIKKMKGFRSAEAKELFLKMLKEVGVIVMTGRFLKSVKLENNRIISATYTCISIY
jgi:hypothetical protein